MTTMALIDPLGTKINTDTLPRCTIDHIRSKHPFKGDPPLVILGCQHIFFYFFLRFFSLIILNVSVGIQQDVAICLPQDNVLCCFLSKLLYKKELEEEKN